MSKGNSCPKSAFGRGMLKAPPLISSVLISRSSKIDRQRAVNMFENMFQNGICQIKNDIIGPRNVGPRK